MQLGEADRAKLLAYRGPGNVRQLRNVIETERAVMLADAQEIQPQDLGLYDSGGDQLIPGCRRAREQKLFLEILPLLSCHLREKTLAPSQ